MNVPTPNWILLTTAEVFDGLYISYYFPKRWISHAGPVVWLPRSPLDFFLWGTLKQKVYVVSINDQSLKQRIVQKCEEITNAQCQSITRSLIDNCLGQEIILNKIINN